jgi:hypothetical protein
MCAGQRWEIKCPTRYRHFFLRFRLFGEKSDGILAGLSGRPLTYFRAHATDIKQQQPLRLQKGMGHLHRWQHRRYTLAFLTGLLAFQPIFVFYDGALNPAI